MLGTICNGCPAKFVEGNYIIWVGTLNLSDVGDRKDLNSFPAHPTYNRLQWYAMMQLGLSENRVYSQS